MMIAVYTFTEEIKNIVTEQRGNRLYITVMKIKILKV